MKHIHKEERMLCQNSLNDRFFDTSSVFFDIETTGFSPAHSAVYLIGCARRDETTVFIDQFLSESPSDEKEILCAFLQYLSDCKKLICYNGTGFDIPFLKARCNHYGLKEHFCDIQILDIFKTVSGIRFLLKLPDYKQKTLERFLGLTREDLYSGGELIPIYQEYCSTHSAENEALLLLHNCEDVTGMVELLPVFSYTELLDGAYEIRGAKLHFRTPEDRTPQKELLITLRNLYPVPRQVSCQYKDYYFMSSADTSTLCIPVFCGELHYFYPNYKDYYYLPREDMAIHKSVASFVDRKYRENAHAYNCYTRKSGEFLPQYGAVMSPAFKKEYKDKESYFEITDDFCASDAMLRRYIAHIFQMLSTASR